MLRRVQEILGAETLRRQPAADVFGEFTTSAKQFTSESGRIRAFTRVAAKMTVATAMMN